MTVTKKAVRKPANKTTARKTIKKTPVRKTTVKHVPRKLHAYPVDTDLFSSSDDLKSIIEYIDMHLEEKDSFTPYMLSICRKAWELKLPKRFTPDLIHDLQAFNKFSTMCSFGKSKTYDVYWFCRDTGTALIIIDKSNRDTDIEDKTSFIEDIWNQNKHHFKVDKMSCKSIGKDAFFNEIKKAYRNHNAIYTST